ncbi:MAG: FAD-dependent oxidoreductase [Nitrospiraceae bacterium]
MAAAYDFDLVVVGGGSAGYAAARTAADLGARIAIVDEGPLGGLCILRGCMPSKALLASADVAAAMRRAADFGLAPVTIRADLRAMVQRKRRLVREFADYRIQSLRDPRFTLFEARGSFCSPHELRVGERTITAGAFIVATGSTISSVAVEGLEEVGYDTSDSIMELEEQPPSLIVLGGGAVGTELGQFFARIGTEVTILQRTGTLLSWHDADVGEALARALREDGMTVWTGVESVRVSQEAGRKTVRFRQGGEERVATADLLLHALGRVPNLASVNLAAAGIDVSGTAPVVGSDLRTTQPHIFLVGDANGITPIVHLAIQQGEIAAYNALRPTAPQKRLDHRLDMDVVFTDPEVAQIGLNERACRLAGIAYKAARYDFADHGKALCLGATHGFVKLLCDPTTGTILGGQIVGRHAGELVHELAAVMYYHGTVHDLARIPHYHPTLAEIVTYPAEALMARVRERTAS